MKSRLLDEAMAETYRKDPEYVCALLNAILDDGAQDELRIVMRRLMLAGGGMERVAEAAPVDPAHLHQALSTDGTLNFTHCAAILKAAGLRFAVERIEAA